MVLLAIPLILEYSASCQHTSADDTGLVFQLRCEDSRILVDQNE